MIVWDDRHDWDWDAARLEADARRDRRRRALAGWALVVGWALVLAVGVVGWVLG